MPEDEESKRCTLLLKQLSGAIGVETLLPLALSYHNKSLSLNKIIEVLTINPAKILKIDKGSLKKGSTQIYVFSILTNLGL